MSRISIVVNREELPRVEAVMIKLKIDYYICMEYVEFVIISVEPEVHGFLARWYFDNSKTSLRS